MGINDTTEDDWNKVRGMCAPQVPNMMTQDQLDDLKIADMYIARSNGRTIQRPSTMIMRGGDDWLDLSSKGFIQEDCRIKPKERFFDELTKEEYDDLMDTGLFSKYYPDATGFWEEDSE